MMRFLSFLGFIFLLISPVITPGFDVGTASGGMLFVIGKDFVTSGGQYELLAQGQGIRITDESGPETTARTADLVIKNACGAYTELLGLDLLSAAKDALSGAGFAIRSGMELPIWRLETYIHYYPGDEDLAGNIKVALGAGRFEEDRTLIPGLVKVILGVDSVSPLFGSAVAKKDEPTLYVLDASGSEETLPAVRRLLGKITDENEYREFAVNKGMTEKTTVYYPVGGALRANEISTRLGTGSSRMVIGIVDMFIVVGPDFAGEEWQTIPAWEPDPADTYTITIRKTDYLLEVHDSSGSAVLEFPISIGSNPDLAHKERVGDSRTPEGNFTVSMIQPSSQWRFEDELAYGTWFIRLSTPPFSGIGIHGTNEPYLIGAPATHGCIRLHTENIETLKKAVTEGTEVKIVY
jgi:hypothetical protein